MNSHLSHSPNLYQGVTAPDLLGRVDPVKDAGRAHRSLAGLALLVVASFMGFAAWLPGASVLVVLLSFVVSASVFRLSEVQGASAWHLLRWALLAWILPVAVLASIVAGVLWAGNLCVALGLGLLVARGRVA